MSRLPIPGDPALLALAVFFGAAAVVLGLTFVGLIIVRDNILVEDDDGPPDAHGGM